MKTLLLIALATGCAADTKSHTRAFVADTTCGQGPYDVHLRADGKTGGDGIEVIACTPRRISGRAMFAANGYEVSNRAFGDATDNQRCVGGRPTIVTAGTGDGASTTAAAGDAGRASAAAPVLVERPFTGTETPMSGDDLCKPLGLEAQTIIGSTMMMRIDEKDTFMPAGADLHIRIWSDVPNDLEGVVFMVRHLTSTKTPKQMKKEVASWETSDAPVPPKRAEPKGHGPPPAPLVEEQPARTTATAAWVPGYWSWTGSAWGWVAGFWRDERVAMPAPRVEMPGAAPGEGAIWIGGTWSLRAGAYVWIGGRWRR